MYSLGILMRKGYDSCIHKLFWALVAAQVVEADRDEVRRLHERVLAQYGLRPSEWKTCQ